MSAINLNSIECSNRLGKSDISVGIVSGLRHSEHGSVPGKGRKEV